MRQYGLVSGHSTVESTLSIMCGQAHQALCSGLNSSIGVRLPHSISSLTTGTWLHFGFLFEIICGRPNSIVCTVLKASSWFCCRSYDFSGLHVQLIAVEFTHMQEQAMEDHNSWIRVTKRKFCFMSGNL